MSSPTPSSLALSAAERAELVRNPEAFARRSEAVLSSVLQKLARLEAERSAERIDSEQQFHKLERSHATLRQEHERAIARHDQMAAERSSIIEARTTSAAESARLSSELQEQVAEKKRAKDAEREGAEERRRLLEVNERKSRQLEAAEKELSDLHALLARTKSASTELERRISEAESQALTAKLQLSSQVAELELASKRAAQAEEFVSKLTAEMNVLRERRAEAAASSSVLQAEVAAERTQLASQLEQAQQRTALLQKQLDALVAEHSAAASEHAGKVHELTYTLQESERLKEMHRSVAESEARKLTELQSRLDASEDAQREARTAAGTAAAEADRRIAELEAAAREPSSSALVPLAESPADGVPSPALSAGGGHATGAAAHSLLSSLVPGTAASADPNLDSKAQLFAKYVEAVREARHAAAQRDETAETLDKLVTELQAKAPRIVAMREELVRLSGANEEMAGRLDAAHSEGSALLERVEALQSSLEKRDQQVEDVDKELNDRNLQLQRVLEHNQKLAQAAYAGATTARRGSSLSSSQPAPLFGHSPGGLQLSPLAQPSPATSSAIVAAGGDATTPDAVITAHLVPFHDIATMQAKNAQLLKTVRALSAAHEAELAQREKEQEDAVTEALREVAELRDASSRQQEALEMLAKQRDMYKALRVPNASTGDAVDVAMGEASGSDAAGSEAAAAAAQELATLRAELTTLKEGSAQTESDLTLRLERAREAEKEAHLKAAELKAQATIYEARVQTLEARHVNGDADLSTARRDHAALSSQLIELQKLLKDRTDDLNAAKAEIKTQTSAVEIVRQEKALLVAAQTRLGEELAAQSKSNAALQQTMSEMSDAHTGWRQAETDAGRRLEAENESLRAEWMEAKAAAGREREAALDSKREAEVAAAAEREKAAAATHEAAVAREDVARLEGQVATMRQLHDTVVIQLRQLREQRTGSSSALTSPEANRAGGAAEAGGVAEELASARRTIATLEADLEAEKGHLAQYKLLAEEAEKQKDEQISLSTEYKTAADVTVEAAKAAQKRAEDERAASQRAELARAEEITSLRTELAEVRRSAEGAAETARESGVAMEAKAVEATAQAEACKLKLTAAEEASERHAAKYRAELVSHSEDVQALAAAREAAVDALKAQEAADLKVAELTAEAATSRTSYEDRVAVLTTQLTQLDERIANADRENTLLHSQIHRLSEQHARRPPAEPATSEPVAADATGGGGSEATELLDIVRRDKALLVQKNELLASEVARLKQSHETLSRQHALAQASLAELQHTTTAGSAAASSHDELMATSRELNILRDSNAHMRSQQEAKEHEAKQAVEALAALRTEVEPMRRAQAQLEKQKDAMQAQLEQEKKERAHWQTRVRETLEKSRNSVEQEAYAQLDRSKADLQKQLEAAQAEAAANKSAKEKVELERDNLKKLEGKLRRAGGEYKSQKEEKERELEEERAAKAALEEQLSKGASGSDAQREEIAKLTAANAELSSQLSELQTKAEEAGKRHAVFESQLGEMKRTNQKHLANLQKASEERLKARKALEEKTAELEALRDSAGASGTAAPSEAEAAPAPAPAAAPAASTAAVPTAAAPAAASSTAAGGGPAAASPSAPPTVGARGSSRGRGGQQAGRGSRRGGRAAVAAAAAAAAATEGTAGGAEGSAPATPPPAKRAKPVVAAAAAVAAPAAEVGDCSSAAASESLAASAEVVEMAEAEVGKEEATAAAGGEDMGSGASSEMAGGGSAEGKAEASEPAAGTKRQREGAEEGGEAEAKLGEGEAAEGLADDSVAEEEAAAAAEMDAVLGEDEGLEE